MMLHAPPSSFGAVLTLPGIAGLVLTMGMAVDANVIIYERIKEELAAGKGLGDVYKRQASTWCINRHHVLALLFDNELLSCHSLGINEWRLTC